MDAGQIGLEMPLVWLRLQSVAGCPSEKGLSLSVIFFWSRRFALHTGKGISREE
jgi:hypothetical protein